VKLLCYDLRKRSFSHRVFNVWNSLPNSVEAASFVDLFKH